jgi:hypothetical protein
MSPAPLKLLLLTDDEFMEAIRRLGVEILTQKAHELVERPATHAEQRAQERTRMLQRLRAKRAWAEHQTSQIKLAPRMDSMPGVSQVKE